MYTNAKIKEIVADLKTRQAQRFDKHVNEALSFFDQPEEKMVLQEIEIYEEILKAEEANPSE